MGSINYFGEKMAKSDWDIADWSILKTDLEKVAKPVVQVKSPVQNYYYDDLDKYSPIYYEPIYEQPGSASGLVSWSKMITPELGKQVVDLGPITIPAGPEDAQKAMEAAYKAAYDDFGPRHIEAKRATGETTRSKRTRTPSLKKSDRVNTPNGPGSVWIIEKDGTVCVELDSDSSCLHEFEKKEIKKIK